MPNLDKAGEGLQILFASEDGEAFIDDSLVVVIDVRNPPHILQVKAHPSQLHLKAVFHMVSCKGISSFLKVSSSTKCHPEVWDSSSHHSPSKLPHDAAKDGSTVVLAGANGSCHPKSLEGNQVSKGCQSTALS